MHNSFENTILIPLLHNLGDGADRQAFFINGIGYSYQRLAERVSTIRKCLQGTQSKIFALAINDHIDTYASILALWMEGRAYVPLHPLQPVSRNLDIIEQTQAPCLLHTSPDSPLTKSSAEKGLQTINTTQLPNTDSPVTGWAAVPDDQLAYILFTSGSTGTPKGVCITRGNIAAFIDSFWKTGVTIDSTDRCLQAFDLTFDVSIQAFLTALLRGACVFTIPYGQVKYLYAASLIMEQRITFAAMAPSMLTYLKPYFDQLQADSLKTTILTAEACPIDLAHDWFSCAKNTEIYDFYGPTEATVYCTSYHLSRHGENLSANGVVAIGKPLANVTAILIDDNGNPVPQGEKGELCIAGAQVTPGYWNNPQKNAAAFFHPTTDPNTRYYHTGDLCQFTPSGDLLYYGRIDHQAKIQGYRVELGEIEYHARNYYDNQFRTVASAFQNKRGLTEIALFVETATQDPAPLSKYLEEHLPHYMIPSRIVFVEAFPLNNSEKIDRPRLLDNFEF